MSFAAHGAQRRAVIMGAGLMGQWHAHAVATAGHSVALIIDPDEARASALARRHRGARVAQGLDEVHGRADVAHICTPLSSHETLARAALDFGLHVIVEKPFAHDAAATAALIDHASRCGRLIVPVYQFLFQRGVLAAAGELADVGPLLHADLVICTAGAAGLPDTEQDRVALEVMPHPLSLFTRLIGEGTREPWSVLHPRRGEIRIARTLGQITASALVSTRGRPTVNQLRLIGERGTITADLFHGYAVTSRGSATRTRKIMQPFLTAAATFGAASTNLTRRAAEREPAYPGLRELIRRFYSAAAGLGDPPISPAEILAVAAAAEQIASQLVSRER